MAKKGKGGRPPSGKPKVYSDGRVTRRLPIPLDGPLKERLKVIAERNRRPLSVECIVAIERYCRQEEAAAGS